MRTGKTTAPSATSRAAARPQASQDHTAPASAVFQDRRPAVAAQRALGALANAPLQRQESPPVPNRTGLPDQLKSGVESLAGVALDDVRVHRNSSAPARLQAHAYAQGTDIHLGPGQEEHLPHEAWHVVQQKQGRVKPTTRLNGNVAVNDNPGLEREADLLGAKALRAQPAEQSLPGTASTAPIQEKASAQVAQLHDVPEGVTSPLDEQFLRIFLLIEQALRLMEPAESNSEKRGKEGKDRGEKLATGFLDLVSGDKSTSEVISDQFSLSEKLKLGWEGAKLLVSGATESGPLSTSTRSERETPPPSSSFFSFGSGETSSRDKGKEEKRPEERSSLLPSFLTRSGGDKGPEKEKEKQEESPGFFSSLFSSSPNITNSGPRMGGVSEGLGTGGKLLLSSALRKEQVKTEGSELLRRGVKEGTSFFSGATEGVGKLIGSGEDFFDARKIVRAASEHENQANELLRQAQSSIEEQKSSYPELPELYAKRISEAQTLLRLLPDGIEKYSSSSTRERASTWALKTRKTLQERNPGDPSLYGQFKGFGNFVKNEGGELLESVKKGGSSLFSSAKQGFGEWKEKATQKLADTKSSVLGGISERVEDSILEDK
ncbi:DUF4157 domain-containing protein [Neolewinella lacunae]|uniref:DUF4157 domain-containing protein n=1 Tax=Neolewinella lacunae TaxID=1517758 RepID=A0A923PI41_9BACT|nr:DUF4157 domain-containing protein [Neolewinella lacunae]MBC6993020.1 DUF4157 domain-containing protein [Neolewinella lacunae]MDN3635842.1 DUF4157 domain-containing protein [Neolewinella lacunae]